MPVNFWNCCIFSPWMTKLYAYTKEENEAGSSLTTYLFLKAKSQLLFEILMNGSLMIFYLILEADECIVILTSKSK